MTGRKGRQRRPLGPPLQDNLVWRSTRPQVFSFARASSSSMRPVWKWGTIGRPWMRMLMFASWWIVAGSADDFDLAGILRPLVGMASVDVEDLDMHLTVGARGLQQVQVQVQAVFADLGPQVAIAGNTPQLHPLMDAVGDSFAGEDQVVTVPFFLDADPVTDLDVV